ncbi:MAG: hypothetical protein LAQ69_25110 [Acidobacteriia bacterium]|nr:hypothetical protein [Terriglobia bacterium]
MKAMSPNGYDRIGRIERNLDSLAQVVEKLGDAQLKMFGHFDKLVGVIERLASIEARADERLESFISVTGEKILALEHTQEETQQNLNTLIKMVGKLIRQRPSA